MVFVYVEQPEKIVPRTQLHARAVCTSEAVIWRLATGTGIETIRTSTQVGWKGACVHVGVFCFVQDIYSGT